MSFTGNDRVVFTRTSQRNERRYGRRSMSDSATIDRAVNASRGHLIL